ncbi:copper homeostasis protein CutC [Paracerasibacillus soli]|uniref:Copper homeostasis protein cutC homolog n=1 Tax=Paracerasibacillus soli TaxID=480284 RepID=A0ABU5CMB6_9BACI|nr:copper homeostasis protein CutC [Virgibacillus soli]MDY0407512.1 copper homeostasis protein CutC [Virgibacillus soli]
MKIEVITLNAADTLQAQEFGADRVELVSAMNEGGLTPSYGTLKNVLQSVTIPVQVMVRPHSFGFVYDEKDWNTIKEDISIIQELGGNRIVFGAVTKDGEIDEQLLEKVIHHAPNIDISFHRAFDQVKSQTNAYKVLTKYKDNVKRILTLAEKIVQIKRWTNYEALYNYHMNLMDQVF